MWTPPFTMHAPVPPRRTPRRCPCPPGSACSPSPRGPTEWSALESRSSAPTSLQTATFNGVKQQCSLVWTHNGEGLGGGGSCFRECVSGLDFHAKGLILTGHSSQHFMWITKFTREALDRWETFAHCSNMNTLTWEGSILNFWGICLDAEILILFAGKETQEREPVHTWCCSSNRFLFGWCRYWFSCWAFLALLFHFHSWFHQNHFGWSQVGMIFVHCAVLRCNNNRNVFHFFLSQLFFHPAQFMVTSLQHINWFLSPLPRRTDCYQQLVRIWRIWKSH